ncbi:related to MutS protein homolog 5 [Pseudozyma flocculosa]|uniref:Related to MutS protein homolog 5 n=1 Tax=Pseudozyma flocculosa TaxID=84751 RepID=A0A5C3F707_9BASI|nr:related to MutS protein homolog 5 [Pseudozyma flocculosa]
MSILVQKGRMGCAVMQWDEQRILLLEGVALEQAGTDAVPAVEPNSTDDGDQSEADRAAGLGEDHHDLFQMLILQYRPETILIPAQAGDTIVDSLERSAWLVGSRIQTRPLNDFSFAIASVQLKALLNEADDVQEEQGGAEQRARSYAAALRLSSRIDLVRSQISGDRDMPHRVNIEVLFLDSVLGVPEDTIQALSIFDQESHASIHAPKGREGLSVMTLLSLNSSRPTLRRWLMFPLRTADEIQERLDAVEALTRDDEHQQLADVRTQLSALANVPRLVAAMLKGLSSLSSWDKLNKSCTAMLRVVALLEHLERGRSRLLQKLQHRVDITVIEELVQQINGAIDWEDRGIDVQLDELREAYAGLPDLLDRVALDLRREPAFSASSSLHVVYFPQIGYLIVVPTGDPVLLDQDPTLAHQFSSDNSIYLKNDKMADLDEHLGDLASFIVDREIELLEGLQELLSGSAQSLLRAAEAMMQLDCLMAFARAASLYDYSRPRIVAEPKLVLQGCRHPLKELSDDSFVPNDIYLCSGHGIDPASIDRRASTVGEEGQSDEANSVLIVTGANSSGKSCLLQQAGLAVFMAHCGSFVPADEAEIGIFDKILTRMKQDESLASEGSSFAKELRQLSRALSASTRRSLVLLDEVGKGCRADDGAGLFCAAITEFLYRHEACPIVLSATHHLQAITHVLPTTLPLSVGHMQTVLVSPSSSSAGDGDGAGDGPEEHLTFLYRLRPGLATASFAAHCAALSGVPAHVVERAREMIRDGAAAACRLPPDVEERLRDEEAIARAFVELDLDAIRGRMAWRDVAAEIARALEDTSLL